MKKWANTPPHKRAEYMRRFQLKRFYGMTEADYDRMFRAQHGLCAICARPETARQRGKLRLLCVDHDHTSKRVRGLLCSSCNRAIGYLADDPLRARALVAYLEGHV